MTPQLISAIHEEKRASDLMKVLDSLWAMPSARAGQQSPSLKSRPCRVTIDYRKECGK